MKRLHIIAIILSIAFSAAVNASPPTENTETRWGPPNNGLQIRLVIPKQEYQDIPMLSSRDLTAQLEVKNVSDKAIRLAEQNTTGGRKSIAYDWLIGLTIGAHTPDKAAKTFFRADDQDDYWSRILNAPSSRNIEPGETAIFRIQLRRLVNDEGVNLLNLQGRYDLQPVLHVQDDKFGLWNGQAVGGNTPVIIDPALSDMYASSAIPADTDQNWGEPIEGARIGIIEAGQVWGRSDWPYPVVRLKLMAKNQGQRWLHLPENGLSWQIEVNGDWYEWVDPKLSNPFAETFEPIVTSSGGVLREFNAGDSHMDLKIEIAGNWRKIPAGKEAEYAQRRYGSGWFVQNDEYGDELILKEGRTYQIRVAIPCPPSRAGRWYISRAVSNPVEITIRSPGFSLEDLEKTISWGNDVDGLQLGLTFASPRNQYYQGEHVGFNVYARNTGSRNITGNAAIQLVHYGLLGYTPSIIDSNGKPITVLGPVINLPVRPHTLSLNPGDIKRVGSVDITMAQVSDMNPNDLTVYCYPPPGAYSVLQTFKFHENEQANWHGELTTGTLTMQILLSPERDAIQ